MKVHKKSRKPYRTQRILENLRTLQNTQNTRESQRTLWNPMEPTEPPTHVDKVVCYSFKVSLSFFLHRIYIYIYTVQYIAPFFQSCIEKHKKTKTEILEFFYQTFPTLVCVIADNLFDENLKSYCISKNTLKHGLL